MTTDEILNKVANHRQKQRELEEEWGQLREQALQECLRLIETFEFSASELNFGKDGRQAKPVIKNVGAPKFQNPGRTGDLTAAASVLPGTSKPRKPVLPMKTCSFSRPLQTRKHSRLDRKANRRLLTAIPQTEIHSCVRTPFLSSTFKTISCRAAPLPFREATESLTPSAV